MRKYDKNVENDIRDNEYYIVLGMGRFVRPILPDDAHAHDSFQDMLYGFLSRFTQDDLEDMVLNGLMNSEKGDGQRWDSCDWWDEEARCNRSGFVHGHRYVFRYKGFRLSFEWVHGGVSRNFWDDLFDRQCFISLYRLSMKMPDGKNISYSKKDGSLSVETIQRILDNLGGELEEKLAEIRMRRKKELESL